MKKVVAFVILLFAFLIPVTAFAQVTPQDITQPATTVKPFDDSEIKSQAGTIMLFNAQTGQDIYSSNPDERVFPASTTKLMTVLIALESGKVDMAGRQKVKVSEDATSMPAGSSLMGLKAGETIPARDLLYGMILSSGNDAAVAMADYLAGSVDAFAAQMNTKAQQLGMTNTHFSNPNGVQDDNHYTTGADMKKLAMAVFQNSDIMKIAATPTYTVQPTDVYTETRTLKNTNKLIYTDKPEDEQYFYQYATGMKTGSTPSAHGCLVASATKGDLSLIALVFGDPTEQGTNRWGIAKQLFDYGFNNYQNVTVTDYMNDFVVNETISNPAKNDPQAGTLKLVSQPEAGKIVMLNNDQAAALQSGTLDVKSNISLTRPLSAPVTQGEVFGTVDFSLDGASLGSAKLVSSRQVFQIGEERAQSEALGESPLQYWAETNLGGNSAVLWWLLAPAVVIVFLMTRTVSVNRRKRKSITTRFAAPRYNYHKPIHKRLRYRGRYR